VIALWLGHKSVETTQVYIQADLRLKEKALSRVRRRTPAQGDTDQMTSCSPSSKRFDYADPRHGWAASDRGQAPAVRHHPGRGIMAT
jgi:hypothetical protein